MREHVMTAEDPASGSGARLLAGLAGSLEGEPDERAPLILLHGLTFDRTMWLLALAELGEIDPGRQVLNLSLPGHDGSPAWPSYDMGSIAAGVHRAAEEAGVREPVVVGHSIGAVIGSVYAARYGARGVINVDQPLRSEHFARMVQPLAGQLRGPGFAAAWDKFEAGMGIGELPAAAQDLLWSSRYIRQDLVTGYWRELLDRPVSELAGQNAQLLAALAASGVPYLVIAGREFEPAYQAWLSQSLPQARVVVWPGSGHFPQLAQPRRFAECLAAADPARGLAEAASTNDGRTR
jgi:pimeloyl-ACP methyl ester carboxylesterase